MRVLVVSAFFPPVATGSSHFSEDVAKAYLSLGHDVLVLTTSEPPGSGPMPEYPFPVIRARAVWINLGALSFRYRIPFTTSVRNFRRILKVLREFRPDVAHINSQLFDLSLLASLACHRFRTPKVLTIHTPLIHSNKLVRACLSAIDRIILRPVSKLGHTRIVAVDKFTVDLYNKRYFSGDSSVAFVPATVQRPTVNAPGTTELIRRLHLEDMKVILSLGHVIPIRSRLPLIEALPRIVREVPNLRVVVVGEIFDNRFMQRAKELGVEDHLIAVGRVDRRYVGDYISIADLETHDLDGHGIGITTLEAMALGVPIFATVGDEVFPGLGMIDNPLIPVFRRSDGLDIAAEIVKLLTLPIAERSEIVTAQEQFVRENFGSDVVANRYTQIFESMVAIS